MKAIYPSNNSVVFGRYSIPFCISGKPQLLLLISFLVLAFYSKAQSPLYYLTSDNSFSTTTANDGLFKINTDGTANTSIAGSITATPGTMDVDLVNNRAFVTSNVASDRRIFTVNLTSGAVTNVLTGMTNATTSVAFDGVSGFLYYATNDGSFSTTTAGDGLYKVKPDGTGNVMVAGSISATPGAMALDVANNRAFISNNVTSDRKIISVNLTTGAVTNVLTGMAATAVWLQFDAASGYLYYLTNDGSFSTTTANDGIFRVLPNGTSNTLVAGSIVATPGSMALDLVNSRAFVSNIVTSDRKIVQVNVNTGVVTDLISGLGGIPIALDLATSGPLPVDYMLLSASKKQQGVEVEWSVPRDDKVKEYQVEKSTDARRFDNVATIMARQSGLSENTYQWWDREVIANTTLYRIKAIDANGQFKYSPVVKINGTTKALQLSFYPNPVREVLNLTTSQGADRAFNIKIVDSKGAIVFVRKNARLVNQRIQINTAALRKGVYMIEVKTPGGLTESATFIK